MARSAFRPLPLDRLPIDELRRRAGRALALVEELDGLIAAPSGARRGRAAARRHDEELDILRRALADLPAATPEVRALEERLVRRALLGELRERVEALWATLRAGADLPGSATTDDEPHEGRDHEAAYIAGRSVARRAAAAH